MQDSENIEKEDQNYEEKAAERRSAPKALVIFEAVRKEAEHELERPSSSLAASGLAAGLSMGFSFIGQALLGSYLPDADWTALITKLGYSLGFLIVILGRQQLFTENTLTPVLHVLEMKSWKVFKNLGRLWSIVLVANVVGAFLFSLMVSTPSLFEPKVYLKMNEIAMSAVSGSFSETFYSGIFAGWLIALIIWLLPFAEQSRLWVIIIITYLIGLGHFSHIIAGSVDAFYGVIANQVSIFDFLNHFFLPTLLGNIVGGVALVAVVNYGQVFYEKTKG